VYATGALKAVLNFGFETFKLHRIEGVCALDNIASYKVMEKSGMIREGRG
jgi:ribosomal-protein-alanine N-acetyltransferase